MDTERGSLSGKPSRRIDTMSPSRLTTTQSTRGPSMKRTTSFGCGLKSSGITFGMHLSQKYAPSNDFELCAANEPLQPAQQRRYEIVMSGMWASRRVLISFVQSYQW